MQDIKGNLPVDRRQLEIPIFMYKNAFFDGDDNLHPGIFAGKLFVLSRKCVKGDVLILGPDNIMSDHLKDAHTSFLIKAPNKKAEMFNAASSGTLRISSAQASVLQKAGADISYFSHFQPTSMFKQVNALFLFTLAYEQALELAIKAGVVTDAEGFRKYFELPGTVALATGDSSQVSDAYAEVQRWSNIYAADNGATAVVPVHPFILGGDFQGTQVSGFLPMSTDLREKLIDYAAQQTVAIFGTEAFGEGTTSEEAVATAREFIAGDHTEVLLTAAVDGSAASIEVLSSGLGLTLPEVTTEDLQDVPGAEAAEEAPATESEEVPEVVVEVAEPVVATVPEAPVEEVEEIAITADLPVVATPAEGQVMTGVSFTAALDLIDQVLENNEQTLQAAASSTGKLRTAIKAFLPQTVELAAEVPVTASEEVTV